MLMRTLKTVFVPGVLLWLIPFCAGMAAFPLQASNAALFDTVVTLFVAVAAVVCATFFGRAAVSRSAGAALGLGMLWWAICVAIDMPMFVFAMHMPAADYVADIGLAYGIAPIFMTGCALMKRRTQ